MDGSAPIPCVRLRSRGHLAAWPLWVVILVAVPAQAAPPPEAPYTVVTGLFDPSRPVDLELSPVPGTQTFTVFAPREETDRFSNGVVLMRFKGRLYAQWQSSARDEDAPDTWVAYATSEDGEHWSAPRVLAPPGQDGAMHSSGGWWTDGETLVADVNVWLGGFQSGTGGYTDYQATVDGEHWSEARRVTGRDGLPVPGVIEQDPHPLPGGRLVTAFHLQPGLHVAPFYTDDPLGVRGWTRGAMENLPHEGTTSRELEPSLFLREGCAVMVFRDQASTFRQLAAESCDRGENWSTPVVTGVPDARAKQSAGNLPDGTAYLVNAPNTGRERIPLAITLAGDGRRFDRAFLLRGGADLQPMRFEGRYKRPGFHYPKSVIWGSWLYVGYATNKEDVQVTRVPLEKLRAALAQVF